MSRHYLSAIIKVMEKRRLIMIIVIILGFIAAGGGFFLFWRGRRMGCDPKLNIDFATKRIKFNWYCKGFLPPEESEEYYGYSTHGSCQTDDNCTTGGCNNEICQSENEEPFVSICRAQDKPTPGQIGYQCRCVENQCQWAKETKETEISCDANNPCPEGKECYSFPDEEGPICWEGDPCEKCASKKCMTTLSYPPSVICQD